MSQMPQQTSSACDGIRYRRMGLLLAAPAFAKTVVDGDTLRADGCGSLDWRQSAATAAARPGRSPPSLNDAGALTFVGTAARTA
jgi:hypothetical protein